MDIISKKLKYFNDKNKDTKNKSKEIKMKLVVAMLMSCVLCSNIVPTRADFNTGFGAGFGGREVQKHLPKSEIELPAEIEFVLALFTIGSMLVICANDPAGGAGIVAGAVFADIIDPPSD